MNIHNPHLLPKVRSRALLDACKCMPCTLRLAGFAGDRCSAQDTVAGCHLPTIGKGIGTKVSDLFIAAGCHTCHALIDDRDPRGNAIRAQYPSAYGLQLLNALAETQSRWVGMGLLEAKNMEVI